LYSDQIAVIAIIAILAAGMLGQSHVFGKIKPGDFGDGYSRAVQDANRDFKGENGHGYDASCPSGHSEQYCQGYARGYNHRWDSLTGNSN